MTQKVKLLDQSAINRSVTRLHETCRQLEALTILMDDTIAKIEAEDRKNLLYLHRIQKAKQLLNFELENSEVNSEK